METPPSGSAGWSAPAAGTASSPDPADREAIAYLGAVVLPALGERASRAVRDALRKAVRDHRLEPMERLSGRHRHELLVLLEQLSERHRRPTPGVLVRLTTVVSATPGTPELLAVAAGRPAR